MVPFYGLATIVPHYTLLLYRITCYCAASHVTTVPLHSLLLYRPHATIVPLHMLPLLCSSTCNFGAAAHATTVVPLYMLMLCRFTCYYYCTALRDINKILQLNMLILCCLTCVGTRRAWPFCYPRPTQFSSVARAEFTMKISPNVLAVCFYYQTRRG